MQRERGMERRATEGGREGGALGILRTDPDPQPSSDIIFWEGKREGEKRMGTKEEKGQTLHLPVSQD